MSAPGKVCTGFSLPYVALYGVSSGTVSYTSGQKLARGVSVSLEINSSDDNNFYADNMIAESAGGVFTSGSVTLTVDGLIETTRKLIMGLPTPESITVGTNTVSVYNFDDDMSIPYVGIGFIVRYQQDGVTSYVPVVLTKCKFGSEGLSAATQGDAVEWQTTELTASVMRDDSSKHAWKRVAEAQASEAAAEAVLKTLLDVA